ncbi:hypothetical protein V6L78_19905 [Pseudomonas canadensis]|uniref:hypothetical protein n=1 Tax=Pseudomonas canadensis TaxID=915099 RepID=UPI0030D11407
MSQLLLPLLGASIIVAYWVVCRRRSLVYRERAADLLVDYFGKHGITDAEKDSAERFYLNARFWLFLPVMTVLAFPVILVSVLAKHPAAVVSKERMAITDATMKMYLTRNPLTGTVCLLVFSVTALLAMFVGLLINRVRFIPSPAAIYMTTSKVYPHFKRHAH